MRAQRCVECYMPRPPRQPHTCNPRMLGHPAPSWPVRTNIDISNDFAVLSEESIECENVDNIFNEPHSALHVTPQTSAYKISAYETSACENPSTLSIPVQMPSGVVTPVSTPEDIDALCEQFTTWDAMHPLARQPGTPSTRESRHKQMTYHQIPVPKVQQSGDTSLQDAEDRLLKQNEFKKL